jgi:hypothetical protein
MALVGHFKALAAHAAKLVNGFLHVSNVKAVLTAKKRRSASICQITPDNEPPYLLLPFADV